MKAATIVFCALAITAACLPSAAHDHATGVVKERMEMMEAMAKRLKAIRERIDGKRDLAAIKADAEAHRGACAACRSSVPAGQHAKAHRGEGNNLAELE